jgi:predicted transglutaminase-like cysteine proteinase
MSATPDSTLADCEQLVADLRRQLAGAGMKMVSMRIERRSIAVLNPTSSISLTVIAAPGCTM